jgi:hypothetical protein
MIRGDILEVNESGKCIERNMETERKKEKGLPFKSFSSANHSVCFERNSTSGIDSVRSVPMNMHWTCLRSGHCSMLDTDIISLKTES